MDIVMGKQLDINTLITERVHQYYWENNISSTVTTLKILAECFGIELQDQIIDAALGMSGARTNRAQCGLIEGSLMFIGILGKDRGVSEKACIAFCQDLSNYFVQEYGSMQCKFLRPEGFYDENPPHLCEGLTTDVICKTVDIFSKWLKQSLPKNLAC